MVPWETGMKMNEKMTSRDMMVYSDDYGGTCMDELNRQMTPRPDETMWIAGTDILKPG